MRSDEAPVNAALATAWLVFVLLLVAAATFLHNEIALTDVVILVSLVVHECGHAIVARVGGFAIVFARLGNGPRVVRTQLGATALELRLFPLTGVVGAATPSPKLLRARVACYAAAGAATAIIIAPICFPFAGRNLRSALVVMCVVQALNLVPIRFRFRGIPRASDGMIIVQALFGPRAVLEERFVAPVLRRRYLQQIQPDPVAALATAQRFRTLTVGRDEAEVMITCAQAGIGQPASPDRLAELWSTTSPSWTDTLLAWCTDKAARDALGAGALGDPHVAVLRQAIARVPDSPELVETLSRALAGTTE